MRLEEANSVRQFQLEINGRHLKIENEIEYPGIVVEERDCVMGNQKIIIQDSATIVDLFKNYDYDPIVKDWIRNHVVIESMDLLLEVSNDDTIEFSVDGLFFLHRSDVISVHIIIISQKKKIGLADFISSVVIPL